MIKFHRFAFLFSTLLVFSACAGNPPTAQERLQEDLKQFKHDVDQQAGEAKDEAGKSARPYLRPTWKPYCESDGECASGIDLTETQKPQQAFPEIHDWNSVYVVLDQSDCTELGGDCTSYQIEIDGDGSITFLGRYQVAAEGRHSYRVSPATVKKIVGLLRNINFYAIRDDAPVCETDIHVMVTSLSIDDQVRNITDCKVLPESAGHDLTEANKEILKLVSADSWISGGPDFVDDLKEEGYDFKSEKVDDIIFILAIRGKAETLNELLYAGAEIRNDNTARLALDWMKKMSTSPAARGTHSPAIDTYPPIIDLFEKAGVGPLQPDDLRLN